MIIVWWILMLALLVFGEPILLMIATIFLLALAGRKWIMPLPSTSHFSPPNAFHIGSTLTTVTALGLFKAGVYHNALHVATPSHKLFSLVHKHIKPTPKPRKGKKS